MKTTPGDNFLYSNLGFGLLGHALSLRGGEPFKALVETRILAALAMGSTAIDIPSGLEDRVVQGHDDSLDPVQTRPHEFMQGAGALLSTAADMLKFLDAVSDRQASPLSEAIALLMATRSHGGLELGSLLPGGAVALSHAGTTHGFQSYVTTVPEWRRGIVVLSNASVDAAADLGRHLQDQGNGMLWFREEGQVPRDYFARLTGSYQMTPNFVLTVTATEGRLYLQATGQRPYRLFPETEARFFLKAVGAQVTFEAGQDGRPVRLILHQNSLDRIAERIG